MINETLDSSLNAIKNYIMKIKEVTHPEIVKVAPREVIKNLNEDTGNTLENKFIYYRRVFANLRICVNISILLRFVKVIWKHSYV